MHVFRVRDYAPQPYGHKNPNVPDKKLEASTEHMAANFAEIENDWIYFFVDLVPPEDL